MSTGRVAIASKEVVLVRPSATPAMTKEISEMLIYEELSRVRIQEPREAARSRTPSGRALAAIRLHRMTSLMRWHR